MFFFNSTVLFHFNLNAHHPSLSSLSCSVVSFHLLYLGIFLFIPLPSSSPVKAAVSLLFLHPLDLQVSNSPVKDAALSSHYCRCPSLLPFTLSSQPWRWPSSSLFPFSLLPPSLLQTRPCFHHSRLRRFSAASFIQLLSLSLRAGSFQWFRWPVPQFRLLHLGEWSRGR
jgi:hypothetical protein